MKSIIIIFVLALFASTTSAQSELEGVLSSIESNNAALKARRELTLAQSLEARTGNSLQDPTISYDHLWGKPTEVGRSGEFNATQGFDFPSVYIHRNRLAKARIAQYGHEYALFRQQLLLQAQSTYIEIVALRQLKMLNKSRLEDAQKVGDMFERRYEAGDVGVLERNRAMLELVNARNTFKQSELDLESAQMRLANMNGGEPMELRAETFVEIDQQYDSLLPMDKMLEVYKVSDPQLLAYLGELRAAEQDIKVSRGASLPKFELGYRHEFALGERSNGITAGMSIPMFGNRNNVKRAKAQAQFAKAQLESSRIDVQTTLRELYSKAAILNKSLSEFSALQPQSQTLELLNKGLEVGQTSLNEYIAEYETLLRINEALVTFRRDYLLTCARINAIKL